MHPKVATHEQIRLPCQHCRVALEHLSTLNQQPGWSNMILGIVSGGRLFNFH